MDPENPTPPDTRCSLEITELHISVFYCIFISIFEKHTCLCRLPFFYLHRYTVCQPVQVRGQFQQFNTLYFSW